MKKLPCNGNCGTMVKVKKGAAHARCGNCKPYSAHHKRVALFDSCFVTVDKPVISSELKRIVRGDICQA